MSFPDLSKYNHEYRKGQLSEKSLPENPFKLFGKWLNHALEKETSPRSMTLATSTKSGKPSNRIVLLNCWSEKGFVFFTNYRSRKAVEITENPYVSSVLFWPNSEQQVRIDGIVEKVSSEESDQYFQSRPFGSQISALISEQSRPVLNYDFLENLFQEKKDEYKNKQIKRPDYWGGYILLPEQIEFWQGRPNRLNDRILYKISAGNRWKRSRLAP